MANEKVLLLEAPWYDNIEDTQATRDIYASAETLLRTGAKPVRMILRPLVSSSYVADIEQFVDLECNQRGPNVIVLSAHGEIKRERNRRGKRIIRRRLKAFGGDIDVSSGIRRIHDKLARSIIVLDSCDLGVSLGNFRSHSGALGVVGFAESVDWVDSSMFVLAMLFKLHQEDVLGLKRARRSTTAGRSRTEKVIKAMIESDGPYYSLGKSLGIETAF